MSVKEIVYFKIIQINLLLKRKPNIEIKSFFFFLLNFTKIIRKERMDKLKLKIMQRRGISSSMKWEKFKEEFAEEPNYKALNCYD